MVSIITWLPGGKGRAHAATGWRSVVMVEMAIGLEGPETRHGCAAFGLKRSPTPSPQYYSPSSMSSDLSTTQKQQNTKQKQGLRALGVDFSFRRLKVPVF